MRFYHDIQLPSMAHISPFPVRRILFSLAVVALAVLSVLSAVVVRGALLPVIARGHVDAEDWTTYPFSVKAGQTYMLALRPLDADADLYLYFEDDQIAWSLNRSLAPDTITWTAPADGDAAAWIHAVREPTHFELDIASAQGSEPSTGTTTLVKAQDRLEAKRWLPYSFMVKAGQTYTLSLKPLDADADLYLYAGGVDVARSLNTGRQGDALTWTAPADGKAVAWAYATGGATRFTLNVTVAQANTPARPELAQRAIQASRSGEGGRVGLQIGHQRYWELPPPLKGQPGGAWGSLTEPVVNTVIVGLAAELLRGAGYQVELLPALIPRGYLADVVVAVHSDAGPASRRGFFADRAVRSSVGGAEDRLVRALNEEYARATDLPHVYRGTLGTQYYYGYYLINSRVPMALIEDGFLTNAEDRKIIVDQPERAAQGIANAIRRFLEAPG